MRLFPIKTSVRQIRTVSSTIPSRSYLLIPERGGGHHSISIRYGYLNLSSTRLVVRQLSVHSERRKIRGVASSATNRGGLILRQGILPIQVRRLVG